MNACMYFVYIYVIFSIKIVHFSCRYIAKMNNMDSDDEKMTFHDASDKALEVVEKDPLGCTFDETLQPVLDFTSLAENRPPKQVNGKKTDVKKFKSDLYAASNAMKMSEVVHNLMQLTTKGKSGSVEIVVLLG